MGKRKGEAEVETAFDNAMEAPDDAKLIKAIHLVVDLAVRRKAELMVMCSHNNRLYALPINLSVTEAKDMALKLVELIDTAEVPIEDRTIN